MTGSFTWRIYGHGFGGLGIFASVHWHEEFSWEGVLWEMTRLATSQPGLSLGLKELGSWRLYGTLASSQGQFRAHMKEGQRNGDRAPFSQLLTGVHGALVLRVSKWVAGRPRRGGWAQKTHAEGTGPQAEVQAMPGGWSKRNSTDLFRSTWHNTREWFRGKVLREGCGAMRTDVGSESSSLGINTDVDSFACRLPSERGHGSAHSSEWRLDRGVAGGKARDAGGAQRKTPLPMLAYLFSPLN